MPIPANKALYEQAKRTADFKYLKPSAYKSGFIVKEYKRLFNESGALGSPFLDDGQPKDLKRWFAEKWGDIAGLSYPVYRPTIRVSKKTPLTASEIAPESAVLQSIVKQQYRGKKNLSPFF
jgi:hypothetical protein